MINFATMLQQIAAKLNAIYTDVEDILNWFPYIIQEIWGSSQEQTSPSDTSRIDTNASTISTLNSSFSAHRVYPESTAPDSYSHYAGGIKIKTPGSGLGTYDDDLEDLAAWCDYHRKRKDPNVVPSNGESSLPANHFQHWAAVISMANGNSVEATIAALQQTAYENYSYKEYYLTADADTEAPENVFDNLDDLMAQVNIDDSNYWTVVYVGRGTFNAAGSLSITKNRIAFIGSGPESTTLGFNALGFDNRSHLVFQDLNFGGNTDITSDTVDMIMFRNCKITWTSANPMNGGTDTFATLTNSTRIVMDHCYCALNLSSCSYSMNVQIDGSNTYITNCRFPIGVILLGSSDAAPTSLTTDTRKNLYVENNWLKTVLLGSSGRALHQVTVKNNIIDNTVTNYYSSYTSTYPMSVVEISGNEIKNNCTAPGSATIDVKLRGTSVHFENNHIYDTTPEITLVDFIPCSKVQTRTSVLGDVGLAENTISGNTFVLDDPGKISQFLTIKETVVYTDSDSNLGALLTSLQPADKKILMTKVSQNKFKWNGIMNFKTGEDNADRTYNLVDIQGTKVDVIDNEWYIDVDKSTHATYYLYFRPLYVRGVEFKVCRNRILVEGDTTSRDVSNNKLGVLLNGIFAEACRGMINENEVRIGGPSSVELPAAIQGAISLSTENILNGLSGSDIYPWVVCTHNILIDDLAYAAAWQTVDTDWEGTPAANYYLVADNLPTP